MEEEGWSGSGVSEQSGSDREGRTEAGTLLLRPAPSFRINLSFLHNSLVSCPTRLSSSWRWRPQKDSIEKRFD